MIKQPLTEARKANVLNCLMKIWVLSEMIKQEYLTDMDVRLTKPELNNFAGRIQKDAESIHKHLAAGPNFRVRAKSGDAVEEVAGQMYRVFNHFMLMPAEGIKTFMDNIQILQSGEKEQPEQMAIDALRGLLQYDQEMLNAWSLGSQPITLSFTPKHLRDAVEAIEACNRMNY